MRKPKKFNPHPFDYHQEIELEISSLSNLGVGIARVQLEDQGSHDSQDEPRRSTTRLGRLCTTHPTGRESLGAHFPQRQITQPG